ATAANMNGERPLLGVGPDNFERRAPNLQPTEAPETISEACGSYPELAATLGVPAMLVFVAAIAFTLYRGFGRSRRVQHHWQIPLPAGESKQVVPERDRMPRWEFFLGGAFGLIIGLGLRVNDLPGAEYSNAILQAGGAAVARAIVWFLAFALFETGNWNTAQRRRALNIGLAFVAGFLPCVGGRLRRPRRARLLSCVRLPFS